ncbi:ATP-binding protein [Marinitenerispora sediminis]|uniref:ATP-binding protein n=1 Tax=Marinitenerispora sediminis TaxID=1931232 RepID=A0A368SXP8_9ACTN|nr:ATP-binding protein [Marinitenerispora sediminis]RCV47478.1 ATP-binding protein [Marinitenerispora sediminis]RCV48566.1 ATP-binding protein [Marinitenerispora sediminis]RCV57488.1 ATP-binding protein [Marinitenerispora sediminis]
MTNAPIFAINTEHVLPGTTSGVRQARAVTTGTLTGHYTADLVDTAQLCVSEAVTNALRHTHSGDPGGTVILRLYTLALGASLYIDVEDQGPLKPGDRPRISERAADPFSEHGRGLYLIHELTRYWMYISGGDGRGCLCLTLDTTTGRTPAMNDDLDPQATA